MAGIIFIILNHLIGETHIQKSLWKQSFFTLKKYWHLHVSESDQIFQLKKRLKEIPCFHSPDTVILINKTYI